MASAAIDTGHRPEANGSWRAWLPMPVMLVVWAFALLAATAAILQPFPTTADELEHLSMVRTEYQRPALFPDYAAARILKQDDLHTFTSDHNYINHPSPYYWLMAQAMRLSDAVRVLRLANVALALLALVLVVWAGMRLFADIAGRTIFAALAASFPKAVPVAGMINNDNLAALAGACVFAGTVGSPGAAWWLAAGLALAGWSKLTALIALGAVVTGERLWRWRSGEAEAAGAATAIIAGGAFAGAVPYLVNLARSGALVPIDQARYFVEPAHRVALDLPGFVRYFAEHLASKWGASEGTLPIALAVLIILTPLIGAIGGFARAKDARSIAAGYALGLVTMLAIHFWFGWRSYVELGDLTIAQTRYYNVLWPGAALGGALLLAALWRRSRAAAGGVLALYLVPTALGAILIGYL